MAKQDSTKNWDELKMKCEVELFVKEKHDKKSITNWWFKTYENSQTKIEVEEPIKSEEKLVEN